MFEKLLFFFSKHLHNTFCPCSPFSTLLWTKSVEKLGKMLKLNGNRKVLSFLSFPVSTWYFRYKTATNSSEKPTGEHILSLLTLSNVSINKVFQKFEKKG